MLTIHPKDDDTACSSAYDAGKKVRALVDKAAHSARDVVATTEKQIRQHPVVATAVAGGLGFLLATLFRRRR